MFHKISSLPALYMACPYKSVVWWIYICYVTLSRVQLDVHVYCMCPEYRVHGDGDLGLVCAWGWGVLVSMGMNRWGWERLWCSGWVYWWVREGWATVVSVWMFMIISEYVFVRRVVCQEATYIKRMIKDAFCLGWREGIWNISEKMWWSTYLASLHHL